MADEPMTGERLAEIRASVHNINERGRYSGAVSPSEVIYAHDVTALLAEVDRLRTREAVLLDMLFHATHIVSPYEKWYGTPDIPVPLSAREAAAMAIVRAVANATGWYDSDGPTVCMFCTKEDERDSKDWALEHAPDCPVTKARALLAEK